VEARLSFPCRIYKSPPADPSDISKIQVLNRAINGGELLDEHTFDVLLGMDVLTTGNLHISKDGSFRFLFGEQVDLGTPLGEIRLIQTIPLPRMSHSLIAATLTPR